MWTEEADHFFPLLSRNIMELKSKRTFKNKQIKRNTNTVINGGLVYCQYICIYVRHE